MILASLGGRSGVQCGMERGVAVMCTFCGKFLEIAEWSANVEEILCDLKASWARLHGQVRASAGKVEPEAKHRTLRLGSVLTSFREL